MLRLTKSRSATGAKQYFDDALQIADYYQSGDKIIGQWFGIFAGHLGLFGGVKRSDFHAVVDNRHPVTGATLTGRQRADRIPGFDLTASAPKSISILYAKTHDPRLLEIHHRANDQMLQEVEKDMKTRVRVGVANRHDNRTTGNLVAAQFTHHFARPVDNVADPHLHTHNYCLSLSWDEIEGKVKAVQIGDITAHREYYEAIYHSELALAARELGYEIEGQGKYWEVDGIDKELRDHYSRRTKEIEASAKAKGITDARNKAQEGVRTRAEKDVDASDAEMFEMAMARLLPSHGHSLNKVINNARHRVSGKREQVTPEKAWQYALDHCFDKQSVIDETKLFSHALWRGFGDVTLEQLQEQATKSDLVRKEISTKVNGQLSTRMMASRQSSLAAEECMIDFVLSGRVSCRQLGHGDYLIKNDILNVGQRAAVMHVLTSPDRVMMIRGGGGVGKTTALRELRDALVDSRRKVFAFATRTSSRDTLANEGFKGASTTQMLLMNDRMQQELGPGAIVLVDEAGMLSIPEMNQLFDLVLKNDWRLVLVGDSSQHQSVEWGDAMRLIESRGALRPAEITNIMRQTGTYKEAVEWIRIGDMAEAWKRLDAMGAVNQSDDFIAKAADAYLEARKTNQSVLVADPVHSEKDLISTRIRAGLKEQGILSKRDKSVFGLRPLHWTESQKGIALRYEVGFLIRFDQHTPGAARGSLWEVTGVNRNQVLLESSEGKVFALPLELSKRFSVYMQQNIALSAGDDIRITRGGTTISGKRLTAGNTYSVNAITKTGDIVVDNGEVIDNQFGHIDHAYCWTSHAAQSKTIDKVIVAMGAEALPAVNMNQFLVSATRGAKQVAVYSDKIDAVRVATQQVADRASTRELFQGKTDVFGRSTSRPERIANYRMRIEKTARRLAVERGRDFVVDADLMNQARQVVMAEYQGRLGDQGADIGR